MFNLFETNTTALAVCLFILGLVVGSFINVVIHRLPTMLKRNWRRECLSFLEQEPEIDKIEHYNLAVPASHCPKCQHKIRMWENIPVISFLFLRGRCGKCQNKISWRYPLVELISAVVAMYIGIEFYATWECVVALLFSWAMIALIFIDIDEQMLPDVITLPILWLGLLINSFNMFASVQDAIIGAIAGYLILWSVSKGYYLLTKREGMGHGDFKLLAAIGAWIGWQSLPFVILIASAAGVIIGGGMLILSKQHRHTPIAFGPYLAIAGWIVMVWGGSWYYVIGV
tara:strand:+ start:25428 stop:26282 length:855 start_codon:yes stop_codon:yes gene_type:complete